MQNLIYSLADGLAIARRNVLKIKRVPELLVGVLVMPLIFVFMFAYVFGSSIDVPGGSYREFLVGGAFVTIIAVRAPAASRNFHPGQFFRLQNFESLDPANTLWGKPYNLYSKVDTEEPRFLGFEIDRDAFIFYIFSGALTPMSDSPLASVWRTAAHSASRAVRNASSSTRMRSAL